MLPYLNISSHQVMVKMLLIEIHVKFTLYNKIQKFEWDISERLQNKLSSIQPHIFCHESRKLVESCKEHDIAPPMVLLSLGFAIENLFLVSFSDMNNQMSYVWLENVLTFFQNIACPTLLRSDWSTPSIPSYPRAANWGYQNVSYHL